MERLLAKKISHSGEFKQERNLWKVTESLTEYCVEWKLCLKSCRRTGFKLSLLNQVLLSPPAGITKEENKSSCREWEALELRTEEENMTVEPSVESYRTKQNNCYYRVMTRPQVGNTYLLIFLLCWIKLTAPQVIFKNTDGWKPQSPKEQLPKFLKNVSVLSEVLKKLLQQKMVRCWEDITSLLAQFPPSQSLPLLLRETLGWPILWRMSSGK